jgi:hypothetical protein
MSDGRRPDWRMRNPWLVPVVVFVAAAGAGLAGWTTTALVGVGIGFAALLIIGGLRRRSGGGPVQEIGPDLMADIRDERERSGETAAVRHLRAQRPDLSLGHAVRVVRGL